MAPLRLPHLATQSYLSEITMCRNYNKLILCPGNENKERTDFRESMLTLCLFDLSHFQILVIFPISTFVFESRKVRLSKIELECWKEKVLRTFCWALEPFWNLTLSTSFLPLTLKNVDQIRFPFNTGTSNICLTKC